LPITLLFSINQSNASADKEIYAFTYSRKWRRKNCSMCNSEAKNVYCKYSLKFKVMKRSTLLLRLFCFLLC
jgi:hypothetical protein